MNKKVYIKIPHNFKQQNKIYKVNKVLYSFE